MDLTAGQRTALRIVAALSFAGTNGVFLYYLVARTRELFAVLAHPAALVFVIDVATVMVLLAVYFAGRPLGRHRWPTFVALSLLGGLGFSIPAFVLLNSRKA